MCTREIGPQREEWPKVERTYLLTSHVVTRSRARHARTMATPEGELRARSASEREVLGQGAIKNLGK
eukprot:4260377-Pleurochrysis_carterae.AAC.1